MQHRAASIGLFILSFPFQAHAQSEEWVANGPEKYQVEACKAFDDQVNRKLCNLNWFNDRYLSTYGPINEMNSEQKKTLENVQALQSQLKEEIKLKNPIQCKFVSSTRVLCDSNEYELVKKKRLKAKATNETEATQTESSNSGL